jgi:hypothetical protein
MSTVLPSFTENVESAKLYICCSVVLKQFVISSISSSKVWILHLKTSFCKWRNIQKSNSVESGEHMWNSGFNTHTGKFKGTHITYNSVTVKLLKIEQIVSCCMSCSAIVFPVYIAAFTGSWKNINPINKRLRDTTFHMPTFIGCNGFSTNTCWFSELHILLGGPKFPEQLCSTLLTSH